MRFECEECHRAGVQCTLESNNYPCSNCLERGLGDLCLAQAHSLKPPNQPPLNFIAACIPYLKSSLRALVSPFVFVFHHPNTIVYLRLLYLPFLLFFPLYYSSQAATVLKCADTCKDDYNEWIAVLGTRVVNLDATLSATTSSPTLADSSEHIELQMLPSNAESSSPSDRTTPEPIRVPPPYSLIQASAHVSSPLARPSPPETVIKLRDAWYHYLDSRVREWKIAGTTACVFVAASPTIFQIPDASDDPVTRSIAFFALCRALSGIVYGPIFPIYFRTLRARSAHFAMLWAQNTKKSQTSFFRGQWIMLSLPAVATSWAMIAFVTAIFAYIWRSGSVADPSDWSSATTGRQPMSVDLALIVRIVITLITLVDVGCFVGIWLTLKSYDEVVWRDEDGGDAFPPTPRSGQRFGNLTP